MCVQNLPKRNSGVFISSLPRSIGATMGVRCRLPGHKQGSAGNVHSVLDSEVEGFRFILH
ncbi:hypothetical protein AB205_0166090 [Aquarana catesbeiana]|uniref:Uncharacterized protein n=1 Tax=Aquarana catesbeiana TaxID=8400 RepID=A0A2G9QFE7_AQUCT|nr:hypothetical protein AB205_0166090 [Aquarana catesbeiana]